MYSSRLVKSEFYQYSGVAKYFNSDPVYYTFANVCSSFGVSCLKLSKSVSLLRYQGEYAVYRNNEPGKNSIVSAKICRDKRLASSLVRRNGFCVPDSISISSRRKEKLFDLDDKMFPCVVKPYSSYGGKGITLNINSREQLAEAFDLAAEHSDAVIIESFLPGSDYRLYVVGDGVVAATQRHEAYVIGDGERSVSQLVAKKNAIRRKNPRLRKLLIKLDSVAERILSKQGMGAEDIPEHGKMVKLRDVRNVSSGGESFDVTDVVHPDFAEVAYRIHSLFPGIFSSGVDLIAEDITRPPKSQVWGFIEINANASIIHHNLSEMGASRNVVKSILHNSFSLGEGVLRKAEHFELDLSGVSEGALKKLVLREVSVRGISGDLSFGDGKVRINLYGPGQAVQDVKEVIKEMVYKEPFVPRLCDVGAKAFKGFFVYEGSFQAPLIDYSRGEMRGFSRASSLHRQVLISSALRRGFEVAHEGRRLFRVIGEEGDVWFYDAMPDFTSYGDRLIANSKSISKRLLNSYGVKTPEGKVFSGDQIEDACAYASELGYPVVVKPLSGSGGKGVYPNIRNESALTEVWNPDRQCILEKHIEGSDYRLFIICGKIVCAAKRVPAYVVGDGSSSISQLVDEKSKRRSQNPYLGSKRFSLNDEMKRRLHSHGMNEDTVLESGRKVQLIDAANIGTGGESHDVTDSVHLGWSKVALEVQGIFNDAIHVGVDLLAKDVSMSPDDQEWAICEVNANPDVAMHHFPHVGKPRDAAGWLIEHVAQRKFITPKKRTRVEKYYVVEGRVQGVGYRKYIATIARRYGIAGGVANLQNGSVFLYLHGDSNAVAYVTQLAGKGPSKAEVTRLSSASDSQALTLYDIEF
jgi:D-alanine-D-alanine ligase-like ATP-grasp enzyme/acylphosphatase